MNKKYIKTIGLSCFISLSAVAQQSITGTIIDKQNSPVLGAMVISVLDPSQKTITDKDGFFSIDSEIGEYIEIVGINGENKRVLVTGTMMHIELDDFDVQVHNRGMSGTKINQTQSVFTLSSEDIERNSSVDLSNTLYGLIPGLMVKQNTGWNDSADLMVRGGGSLSGTSPLVIVDGIPRDIKYLNTIDIESISVLKDGPATAVWGTRGANGVIMVTTKRGQYKNRAIDINYTHGVGLPINQPEFVDGYTYAEMKNEALYYDGLPLLYDQSALEAFKSGSNRDVYSNTNWQKEALRNHSVNNQLNIVMRGGGSRMRYYSSINYKNDYGILKNNITNLSERYNSQMKKYDLNARINLDIDVTSYTKVSLSMFGLLREENRPNRSEEEIFSALYHVPSAAFPVRTSSGLWGGDYVFKKNPIAQIADAGYYRNDRRMLQADMRISQDLSSITKGLYANVGVAYDNDAIYRDMGSKNYSYEVCTPVYIPENKRYDINREVYGDNSALSIDNGWLDGQFIRFSLDAKVGYNRTFGLHALNGSVQYFQESYVPMGRNMSRKWQSYILTAGYNFANRYILDFVLNQSGTSVLKDGDKFRTYPAVSAAWLLSNEQFMESMTYVNLLKLRASWGRSGNDNIDYDLDERYWVETGGFAVQNPPINPAGGGGLHPGVLPVSDLTIELADKYNLGLDAKLFNRLFFTVDAFYDQRKNILVSSNNLISSVIGTGVPFRNIGKINSKGADLSLSWKDSYRKNFKYYIGGTLSYLLTSIVENGQGYQPYDYLYQNGDEFGQCRGLEAIGYFKDQNDIENSPKQVFSDVRPGDIKYKDQNGDGQIDDYDQVRIGYSTILPRIYYGINLGFEYKGFGIDVNFQGVGKVSKMLDVQSVYWPLRNGTSNLSSWYLNDRIRWTEETKDIANVPRLSTLNNANNFRSSTQWLENGAYFKLRNLNIYYKLPQKWINTMKIDECQIYVRGNNLFSLDHIKYMNCEDFSINYPDMASLFVGLNVKF